MFKLTEEELTSLATLAGHEFQKVGSDEDKKYWYELHGKLVGMVIEERNKSN